MSKIRIHHQLFSCFFVIALLGGGLALINLVNARQLARDISALGHNLDKGQALMAIHDHLQGVMAREMRLAGPERPQADYCRHRHAMKGDRQKCLGMGMDDYIAKPVKSALLIQAIGNQLASRQRAT